MWYGNQKAWTSALVTLLSYVMALYGIGDAPPMETVSEAAAVIGGGLVMTVLGYVGTWFIANKPMKTDGEE